MAKVNLDTAPRLDVICKRGDSFELRLDFGTAMPLTTGTNEYIMKVAQSDTVSPDAVTFDYAVTTGDVASSLLVITSAAATMAAMSPGLYVYDLQVTDNDEDVYSNIGGSAVTKTLIYGTFKVNDDVNES